MLEKELNERTLALINLFEALTGVMPIEVEEFEEAICFIVPHSQMRRAVGKQGANVKRLEKKLGKKIIIFPHSNNLKQFVRNIFNNVKIYQVDVVDVMGEKAVTIVAEERDKGKLLGKGKQRIKRAKEILKKLFNASLHVKTKRVV